MRSEENQIYIIKASGEKVKFDKDKLKRSLLHSGAELYQVDEIVSKVTESMKDGMTTKEIYKLAFRLLKNYSRPTAARYKLKQAIMELGPSGFPFEHFIAELLKYDGYKVVVGEIVRGNCVNHEIDVIAEKDNHHFMIECKFHNQQGHISDVKIPLYINSRFLDVEKQWKKQEGHAFKFHQGWVVTNTRFSDDATQYGKCANMRLVSWDYPDKNGLKDWIDGSGLHPVTSMTTLTNQEKQILLDKKIVLCMTLHSNFQILDKIGISSLRQKKILKECSALCNEFKMKNDKI